MFLLWVLVLKVIFLVFININHRIKGDHNMLYYIFKSTVLPWVDKMHCHSHRGHYLYNVHLMINWRTLLKAKAIHDLLEATFLNF